DLEAVVWMSAKRRRFVSGSVQPLQPDFTTLEEALDLLLHAFGHAAYDIDVEAKRQAVLEALTVFPALMVVDDIDSVPSEHANVRTFFVEDVLRTRARVLFTSRRELFGMEDRQTRILGLNREDACQFIEAKATDLGLPATRFGDSVDKILEVT